MTIRRQKMTVSLLMSMALVFGMWSPAIAGEPNPVYNQDGFAFSGAFPGDSEPIGEHIEMIGHTSWPDGFTKDSNATFAGGVFDGTYIWMIPNGADRVIRIDKDSGEMTGFNDWPDGFDTASNRFFGGVYDGEAVWMIPSSAKMVVKVASDGEMTGYDSWPDGFNGTGSSKFRGGVFDGTSVWMIPSNVSKVVKIDTGTGTMTAYDGWPDGFDSGGGNVFSGGIFDGMHIWLIPANADRVIRIDKDTGAMTGYSNWPGDLTRNSYSNFQGGFYDGEYVYMAPAEASTIVKVDSEGDMSTVAGSGKGFYGGAFDGENLWTVPLSTNKLQRYHVASETFTSYGTGDWPAGFFIPSNAFTGGVFDGESLWMIPWAADRVIQVKEAVPVPDLTVSVSPDGNFTTGQSGAAYTMTVTNSGTADTSGAVTVTAVLPAGLTATAVEGDGWDCDAATLTCTREDVLADGENYPVITVTVDVDDNAESMAVTAAAVSGGGDANTDNNTAEDYTTVLRTYTLGVSPAETLIFPGKTVGYAPIEGQTVTISKTGSGDIHELEAAIAESPGYFTLGDLGATTLDGITTSTTFTIHPNPELAVGTYENTVSITGSNGASASFAVSFTVSAAPPPPPPPSISEPEPKQEIITVRVEDTDAHSGTVVMEVDIHRTTLADGSKQDDVVFTAEQAQQTAERMTAAGSAAASIVIPDDLDEVAEVNVTVPQGAQQQLQSAAIELGISTPNVKVVIPHESWQEFEDDLYFKFIPIRDEEEKQQIQARADSDATVRIVIGNNELTVVGRPMTIETNMQNHPVTLIMPLPGDVELTEEEMNDLGIYIEHSDGTKQFVRGVPAPFDSEGRMGLRFTVDKFSTFSLVHVDGLTPTGQQHDAYMNGYPDGTFRPDRHVTRAEMAAILSRVVVLPETAAEHSYTDVTAAHWAEPAIARVTRMGLMEGYSDGTFGADKTISRAEMAVLTARLIGDTAAPGAGFADTAGHWAEAAIRQAQGAGVIDGYDGGDEFRPDRPLTRAETVTIMNKALGRAPVAEHAEPQPWSDVPASHWAAADIAEASTDHIHP